jgi:hypothetical protein
MDKQGRETVGDVPFLFVVDETGVKSNGMMAYGSPIRTSIACGDLHRGPVCSSSAAVKWMTIYSENDDEPQQHALVWHNACFAF